MWGKLTSKDDRPIENTNPLPVADTRLSAPALIADGGAVPNTSQIGAVELLYNGTTLEMRRGNVEGTAMGSGARTTNTTSSNFTCHNASALLVFLNVTVASGTGGLQIRIDYVDPLSGSTVSLNALPTAITAIGQYVYEIGRGADTAGTAGSGLVQQRTAGSVPRTLRVRVLHGDSSSYTYSVGYCLCV